MARDVVYKLIKKFPERIKDAYKTKIVKLENQHENCNIIKLNEDVNYLKTQIVLLSNPKLQLIRMLFTSLLSLSSTLHVHLFGQMTMLSTILLSMKLLTA